MDQVNGILGTCDRLVLKELQNRLQDLCIGRFFGGTVFPDEPGNTYALVSTMNWNCAAAATLAGIFALVTQNSAFALTYDFSVS